MAHNHTPRQITTLAQPDEGERPPHRAGIDTIPIVQESLSVDTVLVDRGGYRIVKRVQSTTAVVDEPLHDSFVEIERRPMGTPIEGSEVPPQRQEGDTLIIPVVKEVLVTQTRLVLVEEVRITRVQGTHRAPQSVSLRHEEISIERLSPESKSESKRTPRTKSDRTAQGSPFEPQTGPGQGPTRSR